MIRTNSLLQAFLLLMLILEIAFYFNIDKTDNINLMLYLSVAVFIVGFTIALFAINNLSTAKQLGALRAVVLFLISYVIVHFQFYVDFVLDIDKYKILKTSSHSIVKSALLSLIGLHSFLLAYTNTKNGIVRKPKYTLSSIHFTPGVFKSLTILSLLWLLYNGQGFYFRMSYGSVDLIGTQLAYAMLIFSLFKNITLLLCINAYQQKNEKSILGFIKSLGIPFNFAVLLHIVATFSSGDRGPAVFSLIGYLLAVSIATNKKVRYSQFLVLLSVGAIFISLWGIVRTSKTTENMTGQLSNAYSDLQSQQTIIPATRELASSIRTLHAAVETVPDMFPHTHGVFQLSYIIESVPFYSRFFPTLQSSVGYNRSTAFLTWIINGDTDTSGVGTTCIADAYIDLGLLGVIIILFLWGFVVKRSEILYSVPISSLSLFQVTMGFIVVTISVYIPRSAILFSFKDVVWPFLVLLLFVLLSNKKTR